MKLSKKYILILVVAVIVGGELFWAFKTAGSDFTQIGSFLSRTNPSQIMNINKGSTVTQITSITLSASKTNLKVGEQVPVEINISSGKLTDGTDLIILYDPEVLSVVLDPQTQMPIKVGSLYREFPLNSFDAQAGKITASGIASASSGVLAKGLFGTVTFQAKKAGVAEIKLDFTPGSTIDSNVIESKTAKDLLNEVNNLTLEIKP